MFLLLLVALSGCEPLPEDVGLRLTQVLQLDHCGAEQPAAYLIESESQWHSLQGSGGRFLPDATRPGSKASQYPALAPEELLIVVAAGQMPSAGYRLVVDTYDWQRELDALILKVELDGPAEGSMQATVLTSPCSVIAIRNYQDIEEVRFTGFTKELSVQLPVPGQS